MSIQSQVVERLKDFILHHGPDSLFRFPYKAYLTIKDIDQKLALGIFFLLSLDRDESIKTYKKRENLICYMEKHCPFTLDFIKDIAEVFLSLYDEENLLIWEKKKMAGWQEFSSLLFFFSWHGYELVSKENSLSHCFIDADIVLRPASLKKDSHLTKILERNPFFSKDEIHEYYEKKFTRYLDMEFSEFCSSFYEENLSLEEFSVSDYGKVIFQTYGFEIMSIQQNGKIQDIEDKVCFA